MRLVNGSSLNRGILEVLHNGVWRSICSHGWGIENSYVVCRQLGYDSALHFVDEHLKGRKYFIERLVEKGKGLLWLDSVDCDGSEASIKACRHNLGSNFCLFGREASVVCTLKGTRL